MLKLVFQQDIDSMFHMFIFPGELIPPSTIRRERKAVGIEACRPRPSFMVRESNRPKRVEFAKKCLVNNDRFHNVAWSDEVKIQMGYGGRLAFRRVSSVYY